MIRISMGIALGLYALIVYKYRVNGLAGSGKSTLMKFAAGHILIKLTLKQ